MAEALDKPANQSTQVAFPIIEGTSAPAAAMRVSCVARPRASS